MEPGRAVAILKDLLNQLSQLESYTTSAEMLEWRTRVDLSLRRIFGDDHHLVGEVRAVRFSNSKAFSDEAAKAVFEYGRKEAAALLKGAIYDLEVLSQPPDFTSSAAIDPELWQHVQHLVEDEQWAQVASQTAIFVESKVREWSGRPATEVGERLMTTVLSETGEFPLGQ